MNTAGACLYEINYIVEAIGPTGYASPTNTEDSYPELTAHIRMARLADSVDLGKNEEEVCEACPCRCCAPSINTALNAWLGTRTT